MLRHTLRKSDATMGIAFGITLMEGMSLVGEIHRKRHGGIVKGKGDIKFDLAGNMEGITWGFISRATLTNRHRIIGDLTFFLQPGVLPVQIHVGTCLRRAFTRVESLRFRNGGFYNDLFPRWLGCSLSGRFRCGHDDVLHRFLTTIPVWNSGCCDQHSRHRTDDKCAEGPSSAKTPCQGR